MSSAENNARVGEERDKDSEMWVWVGVYLYLHMHKLCWEIRKVSTDGMSDHYGTVRMF